MNHVMGLLGDRQTTGGAGMTRERLTLVAWLAIINAVLEIPAIALTLALEAKMLSVALEVMGTALYVYILLSLKALLGERYKFHETDGLIMALILLTVMSTSLSVLGMLISPLKTAVELLSELSLILFGIICIVFAIKLLRLQDSLCGMLKLFSYILITMGFCFATYFATLGVCSAKGDFSSTTMVFCGATVIILLPLALLTSVVSSIILGIIFFRVAEANTGGST